MRLFPAIAAFTILLGFTPAAADDGPLAPAREGKIWCYEPDSENKTCGSFSRFEWDVNGDVWEEDMIAVAANPQIVMKVRDKATLEKGDICQVLRAETFEQARYFVNEKPATAAESAGFMLTYGSTFKTFYGKKFCITLSPYNSIFITEVSMDGTPYPSAASRLKWVSPGDGYALEK